MGWGARSTFSRMSYGDCAKALDHARDRSAGKPLHGNLRIVDRGTHFAAQLYITDIVRYYPDGSIEIATSYISNTTLNAIQELTGVRVVKSALPLFNKRTPNPARMLRIGRYVFNGVGGYIKLDVHGQIDPASVLPERIEIITSPKKVTEARRRAKALCDQLVLRRKLGAVNSITSEYLTPRWVMDNLHRNLLEVDYDVRYDGNPHNIYLEDLYPFARLAGVTEHISFKEF